MTRQGYLIDYIAVNVERLESLSTEVLYALAEKMSLDLPPDLERNFVLEALMEAFEEDNEARNDTSASAVFIESTKFSGTELDEIDASLEAAPAIENRYNETAIHAIVRDPEWAFVFWDIWDHEYDAITATKGFVHFLLRVFEVDEKTKKDNLSFDVVVGNTDDSWYLHLPCPGASYRIDLYARIDKNYQLLAQTSVIKTPKAVISKDFSDLPERTQKLLKLSCIDELEIENVPEVTF